MVIAAVVVSTGVKSQGCPGESRGGTEGAEALPEMYLLMKCGLSVGLGEAETLSPSILPYFGVCERSCIMNSSSLGLAFASIGGNIIGTELVAQASVSEL
jgi:hypothetical protein